MSGYTISFYNLTGDTWTLAVFLTVPGDPLDSVCWHRFPAPPGGQATPFTWDPENLSAVVGSYRASGGDLVYTTQQAVSADPGSKWKVVSPGGVQQLESDGTAWLPDTIQILNDSGQLASPGLGVQGVGAIVSQDILSGLSQAFGTDLTYWVAVFNSVKEGQLITTSTGVEDDKVVTEPIELDFTRGDVAAVTAEVVGGTTFRVTVAYSPN